MHVHIYLPPQHQHDALGVAGAFGQRTGLAAKSSQLRGLRGCSALSETGTLFVHVHTCLHVDDLSGNPPPPPPPRSFSAYVQIPLLSYSCTHNAYLPFQCVMGVITEHAVSILSIPPARWEPRSCGLSSWQ